jgi:mRNA-degrading endonuclease RelE of RelBE toxin-antitoxin system
MTYKLTFLKSAKKEWDKLASPIQKQLVYRVDDNRITIQVITIGKRDKDEVYKAAHDRFQD